MSVPKTGKKDVLEIQTKTIDRTTSPHIFFFFARILADWSMSWHAKTAASLSLDQALCQLAALVSPLNAHVTEPRKSGWESTRKGSPCAASHYSYETRMGKRDTTGPSSYLAPAKTSPVPGVESATGLSKFTSTSNSENAKALCAATDRKVHQRADQANWAARCKCSGC